MWNGVQAMSTEELGLAARVAGLRPGPAERKELVERLLDWVGKATGSPTDEPDELDRAAVHWLAGVAGVEAQADEPVSLLEERVWERLSEDAARHLMPVWRLGSSMAALGPPDALGDERRFLERVAARLLPSQKARTAMKREWEALCAQPARHHSEVLEQLKPDLKSLKERPELIQPALVLALVVALADSNFELEESRLYDRLAAALGVDSAAAAQLKESVSRVFWDARERLSPRGTSGTPLGNHEISLRAAHESLEQAGGLEDLQEEVRSGFLAGLHRGLLQDRDFQKGMKGWRRTPLHWPVGMAVGVTLYLRGRMRAGTDRSLMQVLYLAHLREVGQASESS